MKSLRKTVALLLSLLFVLGWAVSFSEGEGWFCPDCGAPNNTNFCKRCGAASPANARTDVASTEPEEIFCPFCGAQYPADAGIFFCGDCGAVLQQAFSSKIRYEGEGFATPEEALICYMEGLKNLNFGQMLRAFAWETQMEHYDLQKFLERIRAVNPSMRPRMPSTNDFMFDANVAILRFYQVDMIYRSLEQYILGQDSPSNMQTGTITFRKDSDDVALFLQKFENGRVEKLAEMKNIRFLSPDEVTENRFSSGSAPDAFVKQTAHYGADEVVNIVGVADVGDETLYCCPTICRYGDRWYLVSVGSFTSAFLGVPMDYQAFICGQGSISDLTR